MSDDLVLPLAIHFIAPESGPTCKWCGVQAAVKIQRYGEQPWPLCYECGRELVESGYRLWVDSYSGHPPAILP